MNPIFPTRESLDDLDAICRPPCLSLYQTTHRRRPENQQDPIRFGNLTKALEASLKKRCPANEAKLLLAPFEDLAHDHDFWTHTLNGLAVLGGAGFFRVFLIQRPVPELAVVADSFHIKPLRRFLQTASRYQVLGLGLHKVRLFEGDRDVIAEIAPSPEIMAALADAQADKPAEPNQSVASYGSAGGVSRPTHHSQGGSKEADDRDAGLFRAIDRAVLERHSRPSGLPLILAALPQHHHLFRQVSHNPLLMDEGIASHPDALPLEALRERAWQVVEPHYQAQLTALADSFAAAKAKGLGLDDLAQVAQAAAAGRIATLLIEDDRQIAGRIAPASGQIQFNGLSDPHTDDVLDDLGEWVHKKGGRVVVVPAAKMPSTTGVAAICRFSTETKGTPSC